MAYIFPRVASLHFEYYDQVIDQNYRWRNYAEFWHTSNDVDDQRRVSYFADDMPQWQIADDTVTDADFSDNYGLVFEPPFQCEVVQVNELGPVDTHIGWVDGRRGATTSVGWWTYKMLASTFSPEITGSTAIDVHGRQKTSVTVTEYDGLTFNTDTADYVTGPSHTATWEGTEKYEGAGAVEITLSGSPVSGDELILELPASSITLTTTRRYMISGWVYVDSSNPVPGGCIGFNPREYYTDAQILGAKVWDPLVDPLDEWVFVYTIFRPIFTGGTQNLGLWFMRVPDGVTANWYKYGGTTAGTVYTDYWLIEHFDNDEAEIARSEDFCLHEADATTEMLVTFHHDEEGSMMQCLFDSEDYLPCLRVPGDFRIWEIESRDPRTETDENGTSSFRSVQKRKRITLRMSPFLPWVAEAMALGRAFDYVIARYGPYGNTEYTSGYLTSTDEEDEFRWPEDRGTLVAWNGPFYVRDYPFGTK